MRATSIRIEGPYYGSYSLARVNRGLALALARIAGVQVSISATCAEGWKRDKNAEALLAEAGITYSDLRGSDRPDIVLRHTWPVESSGLVGKVNLRLFPWEETRVPFDIVEQFNAHYDAVLGPAEFVCRALEHSGVWKPVLLLLNATDVPRIAAVPRPTDGKVRFLHLSSAFPRKGVDVLLEAYCRAFAGTSGTELTIKTFPNPHNDVVTQIAAWRGRLGSLMPSVHLINEDWSDEAIVDLLDKHDVQVMPSRGEGFGLLVLEGHLRGRPAIIPRSTALAERFVEGVDFEIGSQSENADSHVSGLGSLWSEPDVASLIEQLLEARNLISGDSGAWEKRLKLLDSTHFPDWDEIALQLVEIGRRIAANKGGADRESVTGSRRLIVISSFGQVCGIATYVEALLAKIDRHQYAEVMVLAPMVQESELRPIPASLSDIKVVRCWAYWGDFCSDIGHAYVPRDGDDIILQHHTGFFAPICIDRFLEQVAEYDVQACVMLHSVLDNGFDASQGDYGELARRWTKRFRIMVHSVRERNLLEEENVILFPHPFAAHMGYADARPEGGSVMIGSFGFMRPHKGYHELLAAWPRVLAVRPGARLLLLASLHPAPDSAQELDACRKLIDLLGISDSVTIHSEFLDEAEIQGVLGYLDGVIFPYDDNNEGASGAVRVAMSSHAAIAASNIPLFAEFKGTIELFDRTEAAIADTAIRMIDDCEYRERLRECAADVVRETSYGRAAQWISALLRRRDQAIFR